MFAIVYGLSLINPSQEELQRHYVWLDNKKYIEQHNMNEAEEKGFTLAMNQFADLVSQFTN